MGLRDRWHRNKKGGPKPPISIADFLDAVLSENVTKHFYGWDGGFSGHFAQKCRRLRVKRYKGTPGELLRAGVERPRKSGGA
jgi:hypothetical protein